MSCSERGLGTVQVLSRSVAFTFRYSVAWNANDVCPQRTERRSNALHNPADKENAQEPAAGKGGKRTGDSRAPLAAR